ncbi:MAG: hypothetical protein H7256_15960 [Bdellovibrio sp.]|nr:hypothetical protein [Bdellovibrio sp.]
MIRLILEGVAGVGKTSVLSWLTNDPELKNALIVNEDETLGELFSELGDKSISPAQHVKRLQSVPKSRSKKMLLGKIM